MRLVGMQPESICRKFVRQAFGSIPHRGPRVSKQQQVVGVANITGQTQLFLDEVVNRIEEDVGEELARQITNREPFGSQDCKQVVAGEPALSRFIGQHAFT